MKILNIIFLNIKLLIPLILSVLFTFIFVLPFLPHKISVIAPLLGIITTIFWIVNKPDLMTWSSVLIVGLIHDILLGLTLGTSCLALFVVRYTIIKLLYTFDDSSNLYTFIYIVFGLLIWSLIVIIFRLIIQFEFFNYFNVLFQYLFSVTFSPIIIFLNKYVLNKLKL